ncbi:MAG: aminoacyl-tRNA hydrolase, partial [Acidimicrobiia bacterium]
AELRFDLAASETFPDELKQHMLRRLGDPLISVTVDESRSQWRNRQTARRRLAHLLREAMRKPPPRRPTRPTRASRERRLAEKQRRGERKRLRRPPTEE